MGACKIKSVITLILLVSFPSAFGSGSYDQLMNLVSSASKTSLTADMIQEQHKIVASDVGGEVRLHVNVKFRQPSIKALNNSGAVENYFSRLLKNLPANIRENILQEHLELGVIGVSLTFEQLDNLRLKPEVKMIEPWIILDVQGDQSHVLTSA